MRGILFVVLLSLSCLVNGQRFERLKCDTLQGISVYNSVDFFISISQSEITYKSKPERKEISLSGFVADNMGINHIVFWSDKLKRGFLFVERHKELSEGCLVYSFDSRRFSFLCDFPFAAYTSENGERWNYNNILSYLSLIKSGDRVLLFVNTPIVVYHPNSSMEEILESKTFYHILTSEGFIKQEY